MARVLKLHPADIAQFLSDCAKDEGATTFSPHAHASAAGSSILLLFIAYDA